MAKKILAVLEQREGTIKKSSLEVVTLASKLSSELQLEIESIVIGNEISNINDVSAYGINKVFHFKNDQLQNYSSSAYSDIVSNFIKETSADIIFLANTSLGKDLAPRVAAMLNAGCLMDCVKIDSEAGEILATRPVYAGKAFLNAKLNSSIKIFTIRPNVFKAVQSGTAQPDVVIKDVHAPNLRTRIISFKKAEGKLDVAEADIIVSGGRGLKGPENFFLVENLANAFGAAVGASRAVVDAGWRPHGEQVGQTGKTVSPSLYVACGISGAIQHLAGMSSSKYIVAINKDKDAPIFNIADYGIAGDIFEILPALTEEIKKVKSQ
jgi:electron transfer flavoprotein alpha subunit